MYVFYPLFIKVLPPKWLSLFKESSRERLHFPSETTDTCGKHLPMCPWRLRHCCNQHSFAPAVCEGAARGEGDAVPGKGRHTQAGRQQLLEEAEFQGLEEWERAGWVNFCPAALVAEVGALPLPAKLFPCHPARCGDHWGVWCPKGEAVGGSRGLVHLRDPCTGCIVVNSLPDRLHIFIFPSSCWWCWEYWFCVIETQHVSFSRFLFPRVASAELCGDLSLEPGLQGGNVFSQGCATVGDFPCSEHLCGKGEHPWVPQGKGWGKSQNADLHWRAVLEKAGRWGQGHALVGVLSLL